MPGTDPTPKDTSSQRCPLCHGSAGKKPHYPSKGIVQCEACGLVYFPGPADTGDLYTDKYFQGQEYRDYLADEKALRLNFHHRLADLRKIKPSGRLLEIGCAYGLFLDEARKAGYDVSGVDICRKPLEHARSKLKLPVREADFLTLSDEPEVYDLICMWDTIEHLAKPMEYIQKAGRWLKPGGLLVMTTGDVVSFVSRVRREKWRLVHPPTHLFYFSPATLERAVRQAALERVSVSHVGYHRRYKSIAHALFLARPKPRRWLYSLMTFGGRLDLNIGLNLHDVMMFVARKPL